MTRTGKSIGVSRIAMLAALIAFPMAGPAFAQTAAPAADADKDRDVVFVLGRIENGISNSDGEAISASEIGSEEMRKLGAATVDEALNLIPGANSSNTGGSRNERLIYVRGFDRFQTTLSIDGVRVFLPADNRIDFARFLTADVSEVQVSKGFVSVLNGPGGMGGAVNIVTRKPTQPFEAELDVGATFDRTGDYSSNNESASIGTRQDQFYAQVSGARSDRDFWTLSGHFTPTVLENGGQREHSDSEDWRVNVKAGWTPNDTDEYAISYLKQSGEKDAPYHTTDTASTRFWSWPYWDIESVYFLSRTQITPWLQMRSRVYWNGFDNLLSSFDTAAQNTQTLPRAFNSYYDDNAYGANVTLDADLGGSNKLSGAFHYRRDEHNERQDGFTRTPATGNPSVNAPYSEPWQPTKEDTYSVALEDVQKFGSNLELVTGVSYDWTNLLEATDVNTLVTGTTIANSVISFQPVNYPTKDMNALNGQAALIWNAGPGSKLHISASSRTRFPTLFERFSSRFGTAIPNPDVKPERANNFDVGGDWNWSNGLSLQASLFLSHVEDALISIPVNVGAPFGTVNQTKNAGSGKYWGGEIALSAPVTDWLDVGGNATLTNRDLTDPTNPRFHPQGVPDFQGFVYANWKVGNSVTITPNVEFATERWTVTSTSLINPPIYYQTGDYVLYNLAVDWAITPKVSLLAGGKNLGDENYTLVDGFPEEGRNFYVSLRLKN